MTWTSIDFATFISMLKNYLHVLVEYEVKKSVLNDKIHEIGWGRGRDIAKLPQKSFNEKQFNDNKLIAHENLTPYQEEINALKTHIQMINKMINVFDLADQESLYDIINGKTFTDIAKERGFKDYQEFRRYLEREYKKRMY